MKEKREKKQKREKTPKAKKIKAPKIKVEKKKLTQTFAFKFEALLLPLLAVFFAALIIVLTTVIGRDSINIYRGFNTTVAEESATALYYWLTGYYKDLRVFTKSSVFQDVTSTVDDLQNFILENTQLIGEDFDYVGFVTMDGMLYTSDGDVIDVRDRKYYKQVLGGGQVACIDDPVESRANGEIEFHVGECAINENGNLFGMFIGAVPVRRIHYEIGNITLSGDGYVFLLSGDGTTIGHADSEQSMINKYVMSEEESGIKGYRDLAGEMVMGRTGDGIITDKNTGITSYVFYCPVNDTDWSLGIAIPRSEIRAAAKKSSFTIALCAIVIGLLLLIVTSSALKFLLRPLLSLKHSIADIASGDADLTKKIATKSNDEIADVVQGFNRFTENLRAIISGVKDSKGHLQTTDGELQDAAQETAALIKQILENIGSVSTELATQSMSVEQTASVVTQVTENIASLNGMIEEQLQGISQASSAVEQMVGNISAVTRSTEHMAQAFQTLQEHTQGGIEKQNVVNERIAKIEEQSSRLMTANQTISAIARQTNMLAMNAAIEAAHAGDAGRGFSVVADEIRQLSETSSLQSKQIGTEIKSIQASIQSVVDASVEAQQAFGDVKQNINETDMLVQQIRSAMEESETGSKQITDALHLMNDSSSSVRSASEDMAEGNKAIFEQIKNLQDATLQIKISVDKMGDGARYINDRSKALSSISGKNAGIYR